MKKLFTLFLVCLLTLSACGKTYEAVPWSDYATEWTSFRGNAQNIAVTDAATPKRADRVSLDWTYELPARPSGMILADSAVYAFSGDTVYKIDSGAGKLISSARLNGSSQYSSVSPLYHDGTIYLPLDGGKIYALDAQTLSPKWMYTDPLGGQALSPICLMNGIICTGFWNGETEPANYVMLDLNGNPISTYENKGGFYFAGACLAGDYIVVPSDNGENADKIAVGSKILVFSAETGKFVSSSEVTGDGRASAVFFDRTVFVTTKTGYLYSAEIDADGTLYDLRCVNLGGECTGSCIIYGGFAFAGTSANRFLMIDTEKMEIVSSCDIEGYAQAPALLSDAYVTSTGCVYIYAACNTKEGALTLIKSDIFEKTMDAQKLFTPKGHENYCLSSVICDDEGTIYYSNDSGSIFSLSKK